MLSRPLCRSRRRVSKRRQPSSRGWRCLNANWQISYASSKSSRKRKHTSADGLYVNPPFGLNRTVGATLLVG